MPSPLQQPAASPPPTADFMMSPGKRLDDLQAVIGLTEEQARAMQEELKDWYFGAVGADGGASAGSSMQDFAGMIKRQQIVQPSSKPGSGVCRSLSSGIVESHRRRPRSSTPGKEAAPQRNRTNDGEKRSQSRERSTSKSGTPSAQGGYSPSFLMAGMQIMEAKSGSSVAQPAPVPALPFAPAAVGTAQDTKAASPDPSENAADSVTLTSGSPWLSDSAGDGTSMQQSDQNVSQAEVAPKRSDGGGALSAQQFDFLSQAEARLAAVCAKPSTASGASTASSSPVQRAAAAGQRDDRAVASRSSAVDTRIAEQTQQTASGGHTATTEHHFVTAKSVVGLAEESTAGERAVEIATPKSTRGCAASYTEDFEKTDASELLSSVAKNQSVSTLGHSQNMGGSTKQSLNATTVSYDDDFEDEGSETESASLGGTSRLSQ